MMTNTHCCRIRAQDLCSCSKAASALRRDTRCLHDTELQDVSDNKLGRGSGSSTTPTLKSGSALRGPSAQGEAKVLCRLSGELRFSPSVVRSVPSACTCGD